MTKNFKIVVEYDGTDFFGWQKQKDKKTVQGEIEKVLSLMLNQTIRISGSGRTDAGVHALGQVANFHAQTTILAENLKKGVNSLIKHPIVIKECSIADNDFHAQYTAVSKEYHYVILNQEDPCAIGRTYHWHIRHPLDLEIMNICCKAITGIFDFKSFENTGSPRSSTIREVFFATIKSSGNNRFVFKICASGFLKYMVRNLMGTIVLAGMNKISIDQFIHIRDAKDRTTAGPTAPAQGLFLKKVNYS
ncbi:MAG: tRNA pseudouridine(38-40) synthase TruA [Proteobacteria bacterium]|nr:tRNA pseudouridine(38-40) synthase TruA [Pseudomonadota bacterium]MBU1585644.1 tRNA pseudouridine(38-40) synthase TruA [Pseudomonadota bacterium]MBU2453018.1 tRNA pseudouridine(38-40) synthase TruA [Pseudomonadota bacterium]MBU2629642.1 tRNA pseudouridine(38-40) synthase TruA [Pseudomonadota bacterium]